METTQRAEHVAEVAMAAKVAPPSLITGAAFLGYPIEHWVLWLTFIWWIWLFAEKIHGKWKARKTKTRRRSDRKD